MATMRWVVVAVAGASLAACASTGPRLATHAPRPAGAPGYKVGLPYQVGGVWYVPREQPNYNEVGVASWYGDQFHMKATANGEIFDKDIPSAAHTTLPMPSLVEVTNLDNGRKLIVRVNDRGPFVDGRIIDLSHEAARQLGYDRQGLAKVRVRYIGPAPLYGEDTRRFARYTPPPSPPVAAPAPPPPPKPSAPPASDLILTAAPPAKAPAIEIASQTLAPLPKPAAAAPLEPEAATAPKLEATTSAAAFRVQAGAFSTPENAQKAVARLAAAGAAVVEPVSRNGTTLYRVVLNGLPDQDQAEELRQKVADIGFADARVIRPF
ncbi:septal ring lytic transglycosylase RlpA family protein [Phenylobacterium soli]|uniref:Endolytic peptidoglycan transglycosylase RlpA n=2 Tax=Phenylobacterium soli TaxID=2170551 RepID=A0A328AMW1_9CAUL|nr:septal ring lytic transglycosylase RlpA family protein [Phenylobacterium soli]RAK55306.1 septal ring lytic transglycosylase RlpA family protein [Phenylobacterium soli]